jgi:protein phosphatase 1H
MSANGSHMIRPVITPKIKLPLDSSMAYSECINAGKSKYNEDQASVFIGQLRLKSDPVTGAVNKPITYLYIGLFDGHGGPGCAIKASKELQQIVHEGLDDALENIVAAHKVEQQGEERPGQLCARFVSHCHIPDCNTSFLLICACMHEGRQFAKI